MKPITETYCLLAIVILQIFTANAMIAPMQTQQTTTTTTAPTSGMITPTTQTTSVPSMASSSTSSSPLVFKVGSNRNALLDQILSQRSKFRDIFATRPT
jgi:hypothetical protein